MFSGDSRWLPAVFRELLSAPWWIISKQNWLPSLYSLGLANHWQRNGFTSDLVTHQMRQLCKSLEAHTLGIIWKFICIKGGLSPLQHDVTLTEIKETSRAHGNSLWPDNMLGCCPTVYIIADTHHKHGKYDLMTIAEDRLIIVNIRVSLVCVRVCVCMSQWV